MYIGTYMNKISSRMLIELNRKIFFLAIHINKLLMNKYLTSKELQEINK